MNRFQRAASNYSYYGYLQRYQPDQLRKYQSERHYYLGRRGAFSNLVYKYAADHINYEEDFNLRYKTPPFITNLSMRLSMYWFGMAAFILSFYLGDMIKVFNFQEFFYIGRPSTESEVVCRY